jgi:DNA-binding transcriptional regulator YiaG
MNAISCKRLVNGWSTAADHGKTILDIYRQIAYMKIMRPEDLRKWRERTGYSQGQLARVLEVDVMTVSRWERGIMQAPSYLKWALTYLELKGEELKPPLKRKRKRKKGENEDVGIS